jgi:hypothetical protein
MTAVWLIEDGKSDKPGEGEAGVDFTRVYFVGQDEGWMHWTPKPEDAMKMVDERSAKKVIELIGLCLKSADKLKPIEHVFEETSADGS